MTETTDRPLVTFAVIAYNQERFIREAIEGAFAQTYEPLEIILSDDGSPDRTYQIMQEMAAAYDGPHKVVLNRNEPNLGLIQHFNTIFELSSGELICVNAGDDFSRSDRVHLLYKKWLSLGRQHDIVHSAAWEVNEYSEVSNILRPCPEVLKTRSETKEFASGLQQEIGSTFMYTKRLFEIFGPIPDYAEVEDRPMIFRAFLMGGLLFLDEPLVYYRTGGVSSPQYTLSGRTILFGERIKLLSWRVSSAKCYLEDLELSLNKPVAIDRKYLIRFIKDGEYEIKLSRASYFELLKLMPKTVMRTIKERRLRPLRTHLKYVFWPLSLWFINQKLTMKKSA